MNIIQIATGARETVNPGRGITRPASNASNAVSKGFKRGCAAPSPAPAGIGRDKIALIHVARRDLQLDEDLYRLLLKEAAGVTSSRDLTEAGFLAVMARFERIGFKSRPAPDQVGAAPLGERLGMATPAQIAYIRGLWAKWLGRQDEAALIQWIEAKYHVSAIRFMDVVRAQKAIEGLKRMVARKADKGDGQ